MRLISLSFLLLILFTGGSASAQLKGFSLGPYFEAAWPKGDFEQTNKNGVGVGVSADIRLPGKLSATGSIGYMRFGRKGGMENATTVSAIPIRAGLKYRLPILYFKLESGAARYRNDGGNALILSPGIGVRLLGLDIQGNFESWLGDEGRSFMALRLAYHF